MLRAARATAAALCAHLVLSGIAAAVPATRPVAAWAPTGSLSCGSSVDRTLQVLADHAARAALKPQTLPTTQSYDRGNIAVLEDDGTLLVPSGPKLTADEVAVARAFYRTHGDDYDFLCLYTASSVPFWVFDGRALAFEMNIVQDVQGIGLPLFDYSLDMGSGGRLHSFLELNDLAAYPDDPWQDFNVTNHTMDILAHEAMHRWAAYVKLDSAGVVGNTLLGAGNAHWQFYLDDRGSMVGGNGWADNHDGTWTTAEATLRYGPLERYLMGFNAASEVDSFNVFEDAANCQPPANYTRAHHPLPGVTCEVRPARFSIADVIAANGPRVPDAATAPKNHRFAFVLLIAHGSTPTQADLDKIERIRAAWPGYFSLLTDGLGTADATLVPHAGSIALDVEPVPDSESPSASHAVTAHAGVVPGSLPLTVDAASVTLSYGVNGGPLATLPMAEGPPGTFTAAIPAQSSGSVVRYAVYAASDSAGIDAWWPAGAPAAADTFRVGPDLEPPSVSFLATPTEVTYRLAPYRFRATGTDNLGLARVFVTASWNDGPRDTVDMTRSGASDTFYVDLIPGASLGDRLVLDVHAVDASQAAHVAEAPECPSPGCAFGWSPNWLEPLDVSDGRLVPGVVTLEWGDAWHWTTQSDATGRASWKCGDPGGLHYLGDLDAGLVTPALFLTGDAELRFRHRYDLEAAAPGFAYDGAVVEMSVRGGPWTPITPNGGYPRVLTQFSDVPLPDGTPVYSGTSAGWGAGSFEPAVFPVSSPDTETVRFRFRMMSDGSVGGGGWFVDDLELRMLGPAVAAGNGPAPGLRFLAPLPNPTRGVVRFDADLDDRARLALEIFDARGRRVAAPFAGAVPAGRWSLAWTAPRSLGAGLYFARLHATSGRRESTLARRFLLLR
jgi:hypothetical protein